MTTTAPPVFHDIETTRINLPVWLMTGWAAFMVAGRVICRTRLANKGSWGWDDNLSIVALVTLLVGSSLISASITALTKVDPASLETLKTTLPLAHALSFAANNVFSLSVTIPKIVAAILFIRVFEPRTSTRVLLLGGCLLMCCIGVTLFSLNWASCRPVASQWNPWKYPEHHCWSPNITLDFGYLFGALCAFQDLCLSIYPAFQLNNLLLKTKRKIQLSAVLSLGFAAGVFAIIKTWELSRLRKETKNLAGPFNVSLHVALWNAIENSVAIICTCVPTIMPLARIIREKSKEGWSSMSSLVRTNHGRLHSSVSLPESSEQTTDQRSLSSGSERLKRHHDTTILREMNIEQTVSPR